MKKYQLWLERKSYSQHLFNLIKIKHSHHSSVQKPKHTTILVRTPSRQNSILSRYKQLQDHHMQAQKQGNISYAITYKQLKNRKLREMRTFQILNENMSMARRIKGVKSALNSTSKDKAFTQTNKRKLFQKKCELTNEEIREQNFKKFKNWQNNKTNGNFRFHLTLTVQNITKIMHSPNQYAAAWCQVSTEKGFVRSELVSLNDFQGRKLYFLLQSELPKDCLFRLYICKGLSSELLGQIQFQRPDLGQSSITKHCSDNGQFQVTLKLLYNKLLKQRLVINLK